MSWGARYTTGRTHWYDWLKVQLCKNVFCWLNDNGYVQSPILEIGLGGGEMHRHFLEFSKTVGQDIAHEGLKHAEIKAPISLPEICYRYNWNTIYCAHVLEHLPNRDVVVRTLENMYMLSEKGARIIITVPDYLSWRNDFWDVDYTHTIPFTIRRMEQIASETGYRIVARNVICGWFIGWPARILHAVNKILPWRALHPRLRRAGYTLNRDLLFVLEKA